MAGETGPTGGPALTDVLGTMLTWDPPTTVVETAEGVRVTIEIAAIVSGKPVPPRPSVRLRVSAEEAERRALRGWPPLESAPLGDWVLRAANGFSARANSVLAVGSPGMPVDEAVAAVRAFYDARGLPAWAQVVVGSDAESGLVARGWVTARPGEADSVFQVASVAQVARTLRTAPPRRPGSPAHPNAADPAPPRAQTSPTRLPRTPDPTDPAPPHAQTPPTRLSRTVTDRATEAWRANDPRAREDRATAVAVLEGPDEVGFVAIGDPVIAKGRVSVADDWAGITDVWVAPDHRRQGLALEVMRELVGWSAERGATTVYLQTRGDNPAALALYERLGFVTHHTYRYLTPAP